MEKNQGLPAQSPVPVGDPNIIRLTQYYLDLAKQGRISGIVIVAVGPQGEVHAGPALPNNPAVFQIIMGALSSMIVDINDLLRKFKQQSVPSPIIKPGNGMRFNG